MGASSTRRPAQLTCPESGDRSLHGRVDVAVVEIGQRAVLLEDVKERGIGTGQGEYTTIAMNAWMSSARVRLAE
jgi:hypothetical protein